MAYTQAQYETERAICDKAHAYAIATMAKRGKHCNYLTAEESSHPDYAACNNDMRGRVEQFELLRDMPDSFCAYLESGAPDGLGCRLKVTVWTGLELGVATVHTIAKRGNSWGERQRYGRAMINGVAYRWQGQGAGMYAIFKKLKGER